MDSGLEVPNLDALHQMRPVALGSLAKIAEERRQRFDPRQSERRECQSLHLRRLAGANALGPCT